MDKIAEYYYHKGVYEGLSRGRADALKILEEFVKSNAKPVIVIKQQEVDLEKEIEEYRMINEWSESIPLNLFKIIARYFYGLGAIKR